MAYTKLELSSHQGNRTGIPQITKPDISPRLIVAFQVYQKVGKAQLRVLEGGFNRTQTFHLEKSNQSQRIIEIRTISNQ